MEIRKITLASLVFVLVLVSLLLGLQMTYWFGLTRTVTVVQTVTVTSSSSTIFSLLLPPCPNDNYSTSGYCVPNGYPSANLVENALYYSASAKLNITSYTFHSSRLRGMNNTLLACVVNVGAEPIIISSHDILLNNTFFPQTYVMSLYSFSSTSSSWQYWFIYPLSPAVTVNGQEYVNPSMMFFIYITVPHASFGDNSTLQIYGNSWTFKYGTAMTSNSPYQCQGI